MNPATLLVIVLTGGLLTLWMETPVSWAGEQFAVFLLAGWCAVRGKLAWRWTMAPLAGVCLLAAIQLLTRTTADRWETTAMFYTWLAWLCAHWIASGAAQDDSARETFLKRVQIVGVCIAVLAIAHRTTSQGKVFWMFETGRAFVMGVFPYDNQYAAFVLVLLPGVLLRALRGRIGWIAGAGVLVGSVISSPSVAGSALVLLETVVVLLMAGVRLGWPKARTAGLALGVLLMAVVFGTVSGWGDILTDLERKNAFEVRRQLALSTVEMAQARPAAGWGLGTWTEVYPAYAHFDDGIYDNAAHNDWAQWASDGGVPMLLLMGAFGVLLFVPAVRSVWGVGLLFVLGYCLIEFHFNARPQFGCFFFALAGVVGGRRELATMSTT